MGVVNLYGFVRVNEINLILHVFVETCYFNINFEGGQKEGERERETVVYFTSSRLLSSHSLCSSF